MESFEVISDDSEESELGILPFYGIEQIEADYYGEFGMFDEE
jgi:hypothetical protein